MSEFQCPYCNMIMPPSNKPSYYEFDKSCLEITFYKCPTSLRLSSSVPSPRNAIVSIDWITFALSVPLGPAIMSPSFIYTKFILIPHIPQLILVTLYLFFNLYWRCSNHSSYVIFYILTFLFISPHLSKSFTRSFSLFFWYLSWWTNLYIIYLPAYSAPLIHSIANSFTYFSALCSLLMFSAILFKTFFHTQIILLLINAISIGIFGVLSKPFI